MKNSITKYLTTLKHRRFDANNDVIDVQVRQPKGYFAKAVFAVTVSIILGAFVYSVTGSDNTQLGILAGLMALVVQVLINRI